MIHFVCSCQRKSDPLEPDSKIALTQIAFTSNRDGNFEVYTMNIDGQNLKNLTNNSQDDTHPHFSPDAEYVIFNSFRDENGEIYRVNKDGGDQVNLTNTSQQNEWNVQYSYDGTKIMYMVGVEYPNDIWIMDNDGENKINLTKSNDPERHPHLSFDGSKICFDSYKNGNSDIYIMNSDGSNQHNLTNSPLNEKLPQFSFDGTKIAFFTETFLDTLGSRYLVNVLHILDLKTSKRTNLGHVSGDEFVPRFSPDGSKILFVSTINISIASSSVLCLIDLNDKSVTMLTSEFDLYGEPAFTLNGSDIVFVKGNGNFEIFRLNLLKNITMNLSKSPNWDRWFDISTSIQGK